MLETPHSPHPEDGSRAAGMWAEDPPLDQAGDSVGFVAHVLSRVGAAQRTERSPPACKTAWFESVDGPLRGGPSGRPAGRACEAAEHHMGGVLLRA